MAESVARLKAQWAPQGLVQRSQGKWYPGEPLPRWQIALYWRTDGQPLWTNEALLADGCGVMRGNFSAMSVPVKFATQPSVLVNRRIATK